MRAAHPVRALTLAAVHALLRADVVKRAQALLAVNAGQGYTEAVKFPRFGGSSGELANEERKKCGMVEAVRAF